jgi:hypothetical protein
VTERRTAVDCAHVLKDHADVHFAEPERIVPFQDNLTTHTPSSRCEAFASTEARAGSYGRKLVTDRIGKAAYRGVA